MYKLLDKFDIWLSNNTNLKLVFSLLLCMLAVTYATTSFNKINSLVRNYKIRVCLFF